VVESHSMIQLPLYVSLLVGVASLVMGYGAASHAEGLYEPTRWMLVFGALWAFAQFQRWRWFAAIGFFAALAAAGYGLWLSLPSGWMLAGALGALFAWDLADFERRLQASAPEDALALVQRHLLRLGLLAAAGLVYSLLGMIYWWEFSQEWAGYAAILSALGIALLIRRVRQARP
jgi:hypothetical protein